MHNMPPATFALTVTHHNRGVTVKLHRTTTNGYSTLVCECTDRTESLAVASVVRTARTIRRCGRRL